MEEPTPPADNEGASPCSTSLIARLMNVVVSPGEVFDEVKAGEPFYWNWLVPLPIFLLSGKM